MLYSVIETAKENGVNPYEYLTYVFKNAPIGMFDIMLIILNFCFRGVIP